MGFELTAARTKIGIIAGIKNRRLKRKQNSAKYLGICFWLIEC